MYADDLSELKLAMIAFV